MNNKIWFGVFVLVLCLSASVFAKDKEQPQKELTAEDIVAKLKMQLDLSDPQIDQVKAIIGDFMVKEKQLKLEEQKQLKKVLTSDQLYSWEDLQKQVDKPKKKRSF